MGPAAQSPLVGRLRLGHHDRRAVRGEADQGESADQALSRDAMMDRASELRSWHALGLLRRRVVWLMVGEAVVVTVEGSLLGIAAGGVSGWTLATSVARAAAGFHLPVRWPVATMNGLPIISTVAVACAAGVVAMRSRACAKRRRRPRRRESTASRDHAPLLLDCPSESTYRKLLNPLRSVMIDTRRNDRRWWRPRGAASRCGGA
jgi:hypothetical protein